MAKRIWKLSASLVNSLKACPSRCHKQYVLGIRPIQDTDSQRIGTNWHKVLEIASMEPGSVCPVCAKTQSNPDCALCEGTDLLPDDIMIAVTRYLNKAYAELPVYKTIEEWETERVVLLYSLCGYNWFYADQQYEVVAEEIQFSIPLINPVSGRALPNVKIRGVIDKLIKFPGGEFCFVMEHKSTGSSIGEDSTYYAHLNLDTQTTLYAYAARYLQRSGQLEAYGVAENGPAISNILYDVYHRPGIHPKKLTQAESKKFMEDGEYLGKTFEVKEIRQELGGPQVEADTFGIEVNGEAVEITPGAKEGAFAIKETPEMFGERLLRDISERPDFYFHRKELCKTDDDLDIFQQELVNIYYALKFFDKSGKWWKNEHQCEATFKCPYIPFCYNNVELDPNNPPDGFENIFKKRGEER